MSVVVRKERSDKGTVRLTSRDVEVMGWVGEQYGVRIDVVARLLGGWCEENGWKDGVLGERRTRRVIERWSMAGLADYRKILYGEPGWVWLTRKGLREVGIEAKFWEPKAAMLRHTHMASVVRLRTEVRFPEAKWRGERAIRAGRQEGLFTPDGELILGERLIAIEVELTAKAPKRIHEIVAYHAHDYAETWYFATGQALTSVVSARSRLELDRQERIKVFDLEAL